MSLVYITHHNENIFDVEKDAQKEESETPFSYVSKFKKLLRKNKSVPNIIDGENGKKIITDSKKYRRRTMGYAETPLDPPCAFLRKNAGIKWQRHTDHVCPKTKGMPPIPKLDRTTIYEKPPIMPSVVEKASLHCPHPRYFRGHKHRANFVEINIENNKTAKPIKRPPRYIDTPKGDVHPVLNTGLVPQAVCLKDFGKVPCYLRLHKKKLAEIKKMCGVEQQKDQDDPSCPKTFLYPGIRKLTPNERFEIISGLRENFSDLTNTYQSLSLYTDTMAKQFRKGKLEKDLRQLEQDILLIENNPIMFVSEY